MVRSILIVDDNAFIRKALCEMFKREEDLDVCGEAENGRDAIEKAGIAIGTAEVQRIPENTVAISGHTAEQVLKLLEALEDHDDIQSVSANFDISDQELAQLSAAS